MEKKEEDGGRLLASKDKTIDQHTLRDDLILNVDTEEISHLEDPYESKIKEKFTEFELG